MLNKCSFIGNLGRDPEIRLTQSGSKVGNFTIACSEKWKDKQTGETKEKTEWVRIVVFSDGLCGVIERYLKKGSKVYIEGKMQTRKWQGNDGGRSSGRKPVQVLRKARRIWTTRFPSSVDPKRC